MISITRITQADIVIVRSSDAPPYAQAEAALRSGLADRHENLRSLLLKDAAEQGVAKLGTTKGFVAIGTASARWLHQKLPASAKLVFCMVNDAAEAGLAEGAPSWGVTTEVSAEDQFKLIAEVLPQANAIGVLSRPDAPASLRAIGSLKATLPRDWRVEVVAVKEGTTASDAIDSLVDRKVDVIWTSADPKLYDPACVHTLLLAGLRKKIPVWGFSPSCVRAGALMGVGVEAGAQGAQAAVIVARLLDGKLPAQAEVQRPVHFQIAVNLNVAQQIGVKIPESVSARATYQFKTE